MVTDGDEATQRLSSLVVHALACVDQGDAFANAGDRERALRYYGRALNDYLAAGRYDSAAEVCARMIDRFPDVVRAHCTRAFLLLGEGLQRGAEAVPRLAEQAMADYASAARRASEEARAVAQLKRLAAATERPDIRELIAEQLRALGDLPGAREVLLSGPARAVGRRSGADQRARWAAVLRGSTDPGPP